MVTVNGIVPAGSDDKRVTLLNTEPFLSEPTATIWSFILLMNDDNVSDDDKFSLTMTKVTTMMKMMRVVAMMKMNLLMGKTGRVME